jgi:cellulose biosynthesis protein BcsQ
LLDFLDAQGYRSERVYAFFSMVDGRKRLHRELIAEARARNWRLLRATIPYLSHVEQMGVHRAPVAAFAASSSAAAAYNELWQETRRLAASTV